MLGRMSYGGSKRVFKFPIHLLFIGALSVGESYWEDTRLARSVSNSSPQNGQNIISKHNIKT